MKASLRNIGEIIALISVVVSLLFVGYELRLNRIVATSEHYATAAAVSPEILGLIISHPSIWTRGCSGEQLTSDEDLVFGGLVQAVDAHYFFRTSQVRQGIIEGDPTTWQRRIARIRVLYPGFDRKWREIYASKGDKDEYGDDIEEYYQTLRGTLEPNTQSPTICALFGL